MSSNEEKVNPDTRVTRSLRRKMGSVEPEAQNKKASAIANLDTITENENKKNARAIRTPVKLRRNSTMVDTPQKETIVKTPSNRIARRNSISETPSAESPMRRTRKNSALVEISTPVAESPIRRTRKNSTLVDNSTPSKSFKGRQLTAIVDDDRDSSEEREETNTHNNMKTPDPLPEKRVTRSQSKSPNTVVTPKNIDKKIVETLPVIASSSPDVVQSTGRDESNTSIGGTEKVEKENGSTESKEDKIKPLNDDSKTEKPIVDVNSQKTDKTNKEPSKKGNDKKPIDNQNAVREKDHYKDKSNKEREKEDFGNGKDSLDTASDKNDKVQSKSPLKKVDAISPTEQAIAIKGNKRNMRVMLTPVKLIGNSTMVTAPEAETSQQTPSKRITRRNSLSETPTAESPIRRTRKNSGLVDNSTPSKSFKGRQLTAIIDARASSDERTPKTEDNTSTRQIGEENNLTEPKKNNMEQLNTDSKIEKSILEPVKEDCEKLIDNQSTVSEDHNKDVLSVKKHTETEKKDIENGNPKKSSDTEADINEKVQSKSPLKKADAIALTEEVIEIKETLNISKQMELTPNDSKEINDTSHQPLSEENILSKDKSNDMQNELEKQADKKVSSIKEPSVPKTVDFNETITEEKKKTPKVFRKTPFLSKTKSYTEIEISLNNTKEIEPSLEIINDTENSTTKEKTDDEKENSINMSKKSSQKSINFDESKSVIFIEEEEDNDDDDDISELPTDSNKTPYRNKALENIEFSSSTPIPNEFGSTTDLAFSEKETRKLEIPSSKDSSTIVQDDNNSESKENDISDHDGDAENSNLNNTLSINITEKLDIPSKTKTTTDTNIEKPMFAKSWSQSIKRLSNFIDGFGKDKTDKEYKEIANFQNKQMKKTLIKSSDDEEDEEDEETERDNMFLDVEAMECDEDSMSSSERRYIEENEIQEQGESIGSQDTDDMNSDVEDESTDSFIVSEGHVSSDYEFNENSDCDVFLSGEEKFSSAEEDDDKSKKSKKVKKKRSILSSSEDDEDSIEEFGTELKSITLSKLNKPNKLQSDSENENNDDAGDNRDDRNLSTLNKSKDFKNKSLSKKDLSGNDQDSTDEIEIESKFEKNKLDKQNKSDKIDPKEDNDEEVYDDNEADKIVSLNKSKDSKNKSSSKKNRSARLSSTDLNEEPNENDETNKQNNFPSDAENDNDNKDDRNVSSLNKSKDSKNKISSKEDRSARQSSEESDETNTINEDSMEGIEKRSDAVNYSDDDGRVDENVSSLNKSKDSKNKSSPKQNKSARISSQDLDQVFNEDVKDLIDEFGTESKFENHKLNKEKKLPSDAENDNDDGDNRDDRNVSSSSLNKSKGSKNKSSAKKNLSTRSLSEDLDKPNDKDSMDEVEIKSKTKKLKLHKQNKLPSDAENDNGNVNKDERNESSLNKSKDKISLKKDRSARRLSSENMDEFIVDQDSTDKMKSSEKYKLNKEKKIDKIHAEEDNEADMNVSLNKSKHSKNKSSAKKKRPARSLLENMDEPNENEMESNSNKKHKLNKEKKLTSDEENDDDGDESNVSLLNETYDSKNKNSPKKDRSAKLSSDEIESKLKSNKKDKIQKQDNIEGNESKNYENTSNNSKEIRSTKKNRNILETSSADEDLDEAKANDKKHNPSNNTSRILKSKKERNKSKSSIDGNITLKSDCGLKTLFGACSDDSSTEELFNENDNEHSESDSILYMNRLYQSSSNTEEETINTSKKESSKENNKKRLNTTTQNESMNISEKNSKSVLETSANKSGKKQKRKSLIKNYEDQSEENTNISNRGKSGDEINSSTPFKHSNNKKTDKQSEKNESPKELNTSSSTVIGKISKKSIDKPSTGNTKTTNLDDAQDLILKQKKSKTSSPSNKPPSIESFMNKKEPKSTDQLFACCLAIFEAAKHSNNKKTDKQSEKNESPKELNTSSSTVIGKISKKSIDKPSTGNTKTTNLDDAQDLILKQKKSKTSSPSNKPPAIESMMNKKEPKSTDQIFARCQAIIEAANEAKRLAKLQNTTKKFKNKKKIKVIKETFLENEENGNADKKGVQKINKHVLKAVKHSVKLLSEGAKPKKTDEVNTSTSSVENLVPDSNNKLSKRLPTNILQSINDIPTENATGTSSKKHKKKAKADELSSSSSITTMYTASEHDEPEHLRKPDQIFKSKSDNNKIKKRKYEEIQPEQEVYSESSSTINKSKKKKKSKQQNLDYDDDNMNEYCTEPESTMPSSSHKRKKLGILVDTTVGSFVEEPVTPKKVVSGFLEAPVTPKARGWKLENLDSTASSSPEKSKKRKRKWKIVAEPKSRILAHTSIGDFVVTSIKRKPVDHYKPTHSGSETTDFRVKPLKMGLKTRNYSDDGDMDYKTQTILNKNIRRERRFR